MLASATSWTPSTAMQMAASPLMSLHPLCAPSPPNCRGGQRSPWTLQAELPLNVQARAGSLLNGKFAEYRQAFNEVDTSGNGTIGSSEIQQLFQDLGQPLSETKLWKIFDKYDQVSCLEVHLPPARRCAVTTDWLCVCRIGMAK